MRTLDSGELEEILRLHQLWLDNDSEGKRANLSQANLTNTNLSCANLTNAVLRKIYLSYTDLIGVDLSGANLTDANLSHADLSFANLSHANLTNANLTDTDLSEADLTDTDLSEADLTDTDLSFANLSHANLTNANLSHANLYKADLSYADLTNAKLNFASLTNANLYRVNLYGVKNLFVPLACPEKGSFIGFKKAHHSIIELEIPADARRSSATGRKCRCDKAKVLSITMMDDEEINLTQIDSDFSSDFIYKVGEIVEEPNFDTNRFNECASGIHFFITRQEAINF